MYLRNPAQTNWIVDFDEVWGPYDNSEFKALVKRSREGTPSEQTQAQNDIGKFFLEEAWYVSFSRPSSTIVSIPRVAIQIDGAYTNPKLWQYKPAK
jgi:ABC-type transport system substrate-binding protein